MNVSILIRQLADDPTLADDVPAWLARLNAPTIRRVTQQRQVIVNDVETFISFADEHGGPATAADVQAALAHRTRLPLADELRKRNKPSELRQAWTTKRQRLGAHQATTISSQRSSAPA